MGRGSPRRLIVDSSALLCRYLPDRRQPFVDKMMDSATQIVVTALARTEVELGLHHAIGPQVGFGGDSPTDRLIDDWDRFWVLPIDQRCLRRASDLGRLYGLNLVNSMHLAAIDPVPRPSTLLSVDDRQLGAAVDLGFDVVEVKADEGSANQLLQPG